PWTDLAGCLHRDLPIDRNEVAAALLAELLPALAQFDREGLAPFLGQFAAFDVLAGREVVVRDGNREHVGTVTGLAPDGGLQLALASGGSQVFHAGETSVRAR